MKECCRGRISERPFGRSPGAWIRWCGERSATTSGALARLCRPCPEDTRWRCRPSPVGTPRQWTGRAAAIDLGENGRGVSVKGEDAWRCRWQLQLCWIAQSIRGGGVGGQDGDTPLPGACEGQGTWTACARSLFIDSLFHLFCFLPWNTHGVFVYLQM